VHCALTNSAILYQEEYADPRSFNVSPSIMFISLLSHISYKFLPLCFYHYSLYYKILTLYFFITFITLDFQDRLSHPYLQNFSLTISLSHMHRLCKIIFLSRKLLLISNLKHKFRRLATEVKKNKRCNISDSHSPLRFVFTTFHSTSYSRNLLLNAL
jgi:hypothetical protein